MRARCTFSAVLLAATYILFSAPPRAWADEDAYRKAVAEGVSEFRRGNQTKTLTAQQRKQVKGLIERCRAFIGAYRLETVPAHATVKVDGASATIDAGRLLLDPGEHELVVQAEGYRDLTIASR